ncbi:hypothetical protein LZ30DRAFT_291235 [Colletotrichum cereale]|nr:hypothetical protein LZ30DRAFT_291235 [Colletotrichum cereale]
MAPCSCSSCGSSCAGSCSSCSCSSCSHDASAPSYLIARKRLARPRKKKQEKRQKSLRAVCPPFEKPTDPRFFFDLLFPGGRGWRILNRTSGGHERKRCPFSLSFSFFISFASQEGSGFRATLLDKSRRANLAKWGERGDSGFHFRDGDPFF